MKFSEKKQNTYSNQIIENGGRIWVWFGYHGYRLLAVLFPNNCSLNLFISYRNEDKTHISIIIDTTKYENQQN